MYLRFVFLLITRAASSLQLAQRPGSADDHSRTDQPCAAPKLVATSDLFAGVGDALVMVDAGNYYPQQRDGRIDAIEGGMAESRWVQQQLGRPVIKAFNNIYAQHLHEKGQPQGTPGRIALPGRR